MSEIKKRKRSANWETMEKKLLKECLKDYLNTIENKCTDTNTNKNKSLAWVKVAQGFNELNNKERTLSELKQQWRTMKIDAKKRNSEYKRALKATGGGMKPPSPNADTQEIMEMVPLDFEEDCNQFDSDNIFKDEDKKNCSLVQSIPKQDEVNMDVITIEFEEMEQPKDNLHPIQNAVSTKESKETLQSSKSKLKPELHSIKKNHSSAISESAKERNTVAKDCILEEHNLKITQMTEAHEWARLEHELRVQNIKLKNILLEIQIKQ